ncbi:MAG: hypothetical protein ACUZ8I_10365 [Candidatus Scalindua sp.]
MVIKTVEVEDIVKKAVESYQCLGCVCGSDIECYEKSEDFACKKHVAGTIIFPQVGKVFLGLPTGFDRLGANDQMKVNIFYYLKEAWDYDMYNVPVWKHLDEYGNTIVRGLCPRTNWSFLHVILGDCMRDIDCREITKEMMKEMD